MDCDVPDCRNRMNWIALRYIAAQVRLGTETVAGYRAQLAREGQVVPPEQEAYLISIERIEPYAWMYIHVQTYSSIPVSVKKKIAQLGLYGDEIEQVVGHKTPPISLVQKQQYRESPASVADPVGSPMGKRQRTVENGTLWGLFCGPVVE